MSIIVESGNHWIVPVHLTKTCTTQQIQLVRTIYDGPDDQPLDSISLGDVLIFWRGFEPPGELVDEIDSLIRRRLGSD